MEEVEYLAPAPKHHSIVATCGAEQLSVEWHFDGVTATFTKLAFAGKSVGKDQLSKINAPVGKVKGDVFAYIECDPASARLSIIGADLAATAKAVKMKFALRNGVISAH